MQFSDTTNKDGIIQTIEFGINKGDTGISGDATLLRQFTGVINQYYMKATAIIVGADGRWRWDDTNMDNQPTATTSLATDQTDYQIMSATPSASQDWLQVQRVEAKDSGGNWYVLRHRDLRDVGSSITQDRTVNGQPTYYDFDGASIFLDAKPSYDSTDGLKVWFDRAPIEFTNDDTTKRPGFSTLFHDYLVLGPIYWWESKKGVGNSEQTKRDLKEIELEMAKFYGNRDQYEVNKLARPSSTRRYR